MNEPNTLLEAVTYFSDPDRALAFIVQMRWSNGVTCPHCASASVGFITTRRIWRCKECKKQFSVKVGTIFEDSPIGFEKWLPAMWLIANEKNGISSYELHRGLGVTQKTAWFMLHRIRLAMQTKTFEKLPCHVEADETFIGGLARNMHQDVCARKITGTGGAGKAVVMALLERHGEKNGSTVRAKHVTDRSRTTLHSEVRAHVDHGSTLYTDALASCTGLEAEYIHGVIDHTEKYVGVANPHQRH